MLRKPLFCLAVIVGLLLSAGPVLPCHKTVFGPKEYKVGRFHFNTSLQSFKANESGDGILTISKSNSHGKIYRGFVSLNGEFFSLDPILHGKNSTMSVPVDLRKRNYLWVFLYGQKGASIKLKVKEAAQKEQNHEPVADNQSVELDEDTSASITLTGSDQDGDAVTFEIVTPPVNGTLSGTAPALSYTPAADFNGSDTFTFKVNDGKVDSEEAAVAITVNPVNDDPVAVVVSSGGAHVGEEVVLDGSESKDIDGDPLTYQWSLIKYPEGLLPTIEEGDPGKASFIPLLPGNYEVQLIVNDGKTDSPSDTVAISVSYIPFSMTEQKILAPEEKKGDLFGSSVSVDNHRAAIGAEGNEVAYIFEYKEQWTQTALLTAKDVKEDDDGATHFGAAVAVSGDYVLIGVHGEDDQGKDSGSAYIFEKQNSTWTRIKLEADESKAGPEDYFGAAVALSGDYAVVGAYGDDTGEDEWVQIFGQELYVAGNEYTVWDSDLKLWKSTNNAWPVLLKPKFDAAWPTNFAPIAIRVFHNVSPAIRLLSVLDKERINFDIYATYPSGEALVFSKVKDIGEIQAYFPSAVTNIEFLVPSTGGGRNAGSAYVYKREGTTWLRQVRLIAGDAEEEDAFGISVAVSGQTILVGADMDDDKGLDSGSAYVFTYDGSAWKEAAKLLADDGQAGAQFGASVALSGNVALVGAPGANAAYVFWYNGEKWMQEARLTGEKEGDLFGTSVSIDSDYVVVGAPKSGALYVFKFDGSAWALEGRVTAKDAAPGQDFGGSISISGDKILAGAMGDNDQTGAVYAYTIDTYHTANIRADSELIPPGGSTPLSWSWVNALFVEVGPGIVSSAVDLEGSGSATVSPEGETTYTMTAYGPYGKDVASVTVFVE